MSPSRPLRWLPALSLLALGCAHESPAQPTPAQAAQPALAAEPASALPHGCEASLTGHYHHEDDDTFRYDVTDNGMDVVIATYRQFGATRQDLPDGGAGTIDLHRTPAGFRGQATGVATTVNGKECEVTFPYEVTACNPNAITLRTLQEFGLKDDCSVEEESAPDMTENTLVRDGAPASATPGAPAEPHPQPQTSPPAPAQLASDAGK